MFESYKNPKHEIPASAEAPALRKASGGGASRRQANYETISKYQIQMFQSLPFGFGYSIFSCVSDWSEADASHDIRISDLMEFNDGQSAGEIH